MLVVVGLFFEGCVVDVYSEFAEEQFDEFDVEGGQVHKVLIDFVFNIFLIFLEFDVFEDTVEMCEVGEEEDCSCAFGGDL